MLPAPFVVTGTIDPSVPAREHPLDAMGDLGSYVTIDLMITEPTPTLPPPARTPDIAFFDGVTAGDAVLITGVDFQAGESIEIHYAGDVVGATVSTFAGDFSLVVSVPAHVPPGAHPLDVLGDLGTSVSRDLTVVAAAPTTVPPTTTTPAPSTTSTAPAATSTAPAATSTAPAATSTAPAATSNAPAATSNAPVPPTTSVAASSSSDQDDVGEARRGERGAGDGAEGRTQPPTTTSLPADDAEHAVMAEETAGAAASDPDTTEAAEQAFNAPGSATGPAARDTGLTFRTPFLRVAFYGLTGVALAAALAAVALAVRQRTTA